VAKKILKAVYLFHLYLIIAIFFLCGLISLFNPGIGSLMIYRVINNHYPVKPVNFVPLKNIPKPVLTMVIAAEDDKFYDHWGIDLDGIHDAVFLKNNLRYKYYGGSTITQQLARTLFLIPNKTYIRKYFEIIIAVEMDCLMRKDRILELYLNSIEWGKGIFGIENASRYYFGKSVEALSIDEMIRLVTIMPSPVRYNTDNFNLHRALARRYEFLNEVMGFSSSDLNGDIISNTNGIIVDYSDYIESDNKSENTAGGEDMTITNANTNGVDTGESAGETGEDK
jgi:monofunctional biosynthetic peptidoglycan transglycosylase